MRPWIIYLLLDPRTDAVRYVGVTHGRTRLAEHVYSAKRLRTHTATWIRSLLREGLRPIQREIEQGCGGGWVEREMHWIAEYRSCGADLTNHTNGGEGVLGWVPTDEQRIAMGVRTRRVHTGAKRSTDSRERMRKAQLKVVERERECGVRRGTFERTSETLRKMSAAQKGKVASSEARAKMSKSHLNPSPETRKKLVEALTRRSPEQREAFAKNQCDVPKSEEHKRRISEALKVAWARRKGVTLG